MVNIRKYTVVSAKLHRLRQTASILGGIVMHFRRGSEKTGSDNVWHKVIWLLTCMRGYKARPVALYKALQMVIYKL